MKNIYIALIITLLLSTPLFSQITSKTENQKFEVDVEEFMGYFDGIFSDELIDEVTYNLPEHVTIINYGVGDFTGDGLLDLAISYKDASCSGKTYKVILLVNDNNKGFKRVLETDAKWRDNPFDVGFVIKGNTINITSRKNKDWLLTSYKYTENKLELVKNEIY